MRSRHWRESSLPRWPSQAGQAGRGVPAGRRLDVTERLIGQHPSEALGQQMVLENKPGAPGVQAAAEVARAAPDGYTLIPAYLGPFALAPNMVAKPEVRQKFADAGTPVTDRGPDAFAVFVHAENQRWLPVIKVSGAKVE